jgi:hypothetical protein
VRGIGRARQSSDEPDDDCRLESCDAFSAFDPLPWLRPDDPSDCRRPDSWDFSRCAFD